MTEQVEEIQSANHHTIVTEDVDKMCISEIIQDYEPQKIVVSEKTVTIAEQIAKVEQATEQTEVDEVSEADGGQTVKIHEK